MRLNSSGVRPWEAMTCGVIAGSVMGELSHPENHSVARKCGTEMRLQISVDQRGAYSVRHAVDRYRSLIGKLHQRRTHASIRFQAGDDFPLQSLRLVERRLVLA